MKSSTKLPLAIALALCSAPALALQLGEVRVKSALDEPLVAEIPIQLDNLSEARDLRAGLASQADFDKAAISRAGLDQLRFSIVTDSTGHKLVLITSLQPVSEPYLDFLIEVDNASGKQLREYTVLLDPVIGAPPSEQEMIAPASAPQPVAPMPAPAAPAPSAAPANPAPVQPMASSPPAPTSPTPAPPPPSPPPPPPPQTSHTQAAAAQAGDYNVQSGDTLYRIASENRPDDKISIDQMMLALQSSNPDAFYRDNINNLKSGAILRIPTRDEIASAPGGSQAHAQVRRQNEDWRGAAARKATVVASETASDQGAAAKGAADANDKLALVPPSQGGDSASTRAGEQGGTGADQVAGLKQQLATAKESLASTKQENSELQSRVKDLQDISGKNQKLLGMKDAQIAELQDKLTKLQNGSVAASSASAAAPASAASNAAAATAAKASTAAAPTSAASNVSALASSATPAGAVASTAVSKPAQVSGPVTAKPQAVPASHTATTEELPWYQRPLAWLVAGIVVLALILAGLLRRRPKPLPDLPDESEGSSLADQFGDSPLPDAQAGMTEDEVADADEPYDPDAQEFESAPESAPPAHDYDFTFDEPPPGEPVAEPGMSPPQPPVAGLDDITRERSAVNFDDYASTDSEVGAPVSTANEEEAAPAPMDEFSDDPVDTKLDLARAYLDMGDPAGARAMLEEVLNEGTQMQKDEAGRLLDDMA